MPLNPIKFGLPESNRIVIGENLTRKNALLFKQAQILRREKKIAQTFTEDGLVMIRFTKGKNEPTHTIRNHMELELAVARHESLAQSDNATHNTHTSDGSLPDTTPAAPEGNAEETQNTNSSKPDEMPMDTDGSQHPCKSIAKMSTHLKFFYQNTRGLRALSKKQNHNAKLRRCISN